MATNPLIFTNLLGQPVVNPSVTSNWQFDSTTETRFVAQHDVILISAFEAGPANIVAPYVTAQEIRATYDPANTHSLPTELVSYLKSPSGDPNVRGAYRIFVVRIGQPTAAHLTLQSSAPANVLVYTAASEGTGPNGISLEVANGTLTGKRITRRFREQTLILDNLRTALALSYTGNATAATLTLTRTGEVTNRLQTVLTGASDGSIPLDLDLTTDQFATISQLATYINGQNGYSARVDTYAAPLMPTSGLDAITAQTIRTPIALNIQYTGTGSGCTLTVTDTAFTTAVTGGPGGENLTLDLTAIGTDTLGELVAYIDGLTPYTCTLGPNADREIAVTTRLANVAGQDIRTAAYNLNAKPGAMRYVTTAVLGSIVHAFNTLDDLGMMTRVVGMTAAPANMAQTFLTGGTNPAPTASDWEVGLQALADEAMVGGLLFPVSSDPVVKNMMEAWVLEQFTTYGNSFRAFVATPDFTTAADAKSEAAGYNSEIMTLCFQATLSNDSTPTVPVELPPLYLAAMTCGMAAGAVTPQPITWAPLRVRGLPKRAKYAFAQREDLSANGLMIAVAEPGRGTLLGIAVTTALSPKRPERMLSESMQKDVILQRVRAALYPLLPSAASEAFLPIAAGVTRGVLLALQRENIITQGRDAQGRILPAFKPPHISIQAGQMRVVLQVYIGGEIDHIDVQGTFGYQTFDIIVAPGA